MSSLEKYRLQKISKNIGLYHWKVSIQQRKQSTKWNDNLWSGRKYFQIMFMIRGVCVGEMNYMLFFVFTPQHTIQKVSMTPKGCGNFSLLAKEQCPLQWTPPYVFYGNSIATLSMGVRARCHRSRAQAPVPSPSPFQMPVTSPRLFYLYFWFARNYFLQSPLRFD